MVKARRAAAEGGKQENHHGSFKIPTKRRNGTCSRVFVLQLRNATDMAGKLLSLQPGFPFTYNGKDFIKNYELTLPREVVNKWLFLFVYFSAFI